MVAKDNPDLPSAHILLPLAIFFFIGVVLNGVFNRQNWDIGRALVIGISAPGIITNLINGARTAAPPPAPPPISQPATTPNASPNPVKLNFWMPLFGVSLAHAQDGTPSTNATKPPSNSSDMTSNAAVAKTLPLVIDVSFDTPEGASPTTPVSIEVKALTGSGQSVQVASITSVPSHSQVQIPQGSTQLSLTILATEPDTYSGGIIVGLPERYVSAPDTFAPSVLKISLLTASTGVGDFWWALGASRTFRISGAAATIDGVPYYVTAPAPYCRSPSNGIQRFNVQFETSSSSGWMSGGHNQAEFCNSLIAQNRTKFPNAQFQVLRSSEESRRQLLGGVQYQYLCTIRVQADPVYREGPAPDCK